MRGNITMENEKSQVLELIIKDFLTDPDLEWVIRRCLSGEINLSHPDNKCKFVKLITTLNIIKKNISRD